MSAFAVREGPARPRVSGAIAIRLRSSTSPILSGANSVSGACSAAFPRPTANASIVAAAPFVTSRLEIDRIVRLAAMRRRQHSEWISGDCYLLSLSLLPARMTVRRRDFASAGSVSDRLRCPTAVELTGHVRVFQRMSQIPVRCCRANDLACAGNTVLIAGESLGGRERAKQCPRRHSSVVLFWQASLMRSMRANCVVPVSSMRTSVTACSSNGCARSRKKRRRECSLGMGPGPSRIFRVSGAFSRMTNPRLTGPMAEGLHTLPHGKLRAWRLCRLW